MSAELIIGGSSVRRGERQIIELPLPPLTTYTSLHMPVHVIRGRKNGPRLLVCAALHGDEINGVEIIRRLVTHPALAKMRGDLVAIPIVNVYGFIHQIRYLPDRRDLNRSFPGSETGSMAARLAALFLNEVVSKCTHGIDLHTAAIHRDNLPQVRACLNDPATCQMANAFPVSVLLDAALRPGTIREAAGKLGIPWIVYEAGEALRFDEVSIRAGVRGIVQVMREIGMLSKRKINKPYVPQVASRSYWVRAPRSGIYRSILPMGAHVSRGDLLGLINDPYGGTDEKIHAPSSGIIIGRTNLPLVYEGDALCHIAQFRHASDVASVVEAFQSEFEVVFDDSTMDDFDAPIM
ncbi:succinylglutamate desuccinylase/aspartoacylase family protein [Mariprofundus erugo]|uniref:succinylglutamate desuccinylase/aspartoacylase family protein n=1 Tax=Mariprofundus erugo TaxID=2528639 RepID=UPI00159C7E0B|nr:succinylglutamate desuccinylase/aspartoacylase family protein [Mariprofundus erugo]